MDNEGRKAEDLLLHGESGWIRANLLAKRAEKALLDVLQEEETAQQRPPHFGFIVTYFCNN